MIAVSDFVYGNINITSVEGKPNVRKLYDDNGNSMEIAVGDHLIYCNKSHSQCWIDDGEIQEFDISSDPSRMLIDYMNVTVKGCAYIGKM